MNTFFVPRAPVNTIYATIEKKFYDTIEYASGIKLYKDTGFHPEEAAMLQATVVSVPKEIIDRPDYAGFTINVQPGDTILIRYDVVFSYKDQPDRSTPIYDNVVLYNGVEYWKVDIQKIFGIIRKGEIIMINGHVCCDRLEEERPDYGALILPAHYRIAERSDKMVVKYIGLPLREQPTLSISPGDIVYCLPGVAQAYEINLQKFYIIKQSHLLGKIKNLSE